MTDDERKPPLGTCRFVVLVRKNFTEVSCPDSIFILFRFSTNCSSSEAITSGDPILREAIREGETNFATAQVLRWSVFTLHLADPVMCVCQNAGFFVEVEPSCPFRVADCLLFQTGTECNSPMRLRTTVPRATPSVKKACAVTQIDRVLARCAKWNAGNTLSAILTTCCSATIAEPGAAGVWGIVREPR